MLYAAASDAERGGHLLLGQFEGLAQHLQRHFVDQPPGFRRAARLPFFRHWRHQVTKFFAIRSLASKGRSEQRIEALAVQQVQQLE